MKFTHQIFTAAFVLCGINANAILITDLASTTASAGSCYTGCGNPGYDASNILDDDFGSTGNTGLNSWNSGFYGGYVQVDFHDTYELDRIELYGGNGYYNPYALTGSLDGISWFTIAVGGYHVESALSHTDTYSGVKYGGIHDVAMGNLNAGVNTRFLRYNVAAGSPHWGYLFELTVDGHVPVTHDTSPTVPEPTTFGLFGLGIALFAMTHRRKSRRPA